MFLSPTSMRLMAKSTPEAGTQAFAVLGPIEECNQQQSLSASCQSLLLILPLLLLLCLTYC